MRELEVRNPFDQSTIETIPLDGPERLERILHEAHSLHLDREAWLPKHERLAILERTARMVEDRAQQLALDATREGGKPLRDSLIEVFRAVEGIRTAIAELRRQAGREIPMGLTPSDEGHLAYSFREPRGVVAAVSAFNHPFNLIVHQVIPAVATGCPVIVKPASTTPLSCRALLGLLYEAGLPEAWARMLVSDNEVAGKLVSDKRIGFFSFIGSDAVGWLLRSTLAPGVGCAMEHGGVAPAIVDETADLDRAIPALVRGAFYHAGQVCVSVQRIFVDRSILADFQERFVKATRALRVGDPADPETEVGPLILPTEVNRLEEWVEEAEKGGGTVLCGGRRESATTFAPTVVLEPPPEAKLSKMEAFGPVVALYAYDHVADAVRRANDVDAYFQAALFTRDLERAMRLGRQLNGMAVMVNQSTAFRVDWMPFGGHKNSGLNPGGIPSLMHDLTLERLLIIGP